MQSYHTRQGRGSGRFEAHKSSRKVTPQARMCNISDPPLSHRTPSWEDFSTSGVQSDRSHGRTEYQSGGHCSKQNGKWLKA